MPDLKKHLQESAKQLRKEAAELLALAVRLDRLADPMPYNAEMASESYRRRLDEMTPMERYRLQYGSYEGLPEPAVSNEQLEAALANAWRSPRHRLTVSEAVARRINEARYGQVGALSIYDHSYNHAPVTTHQFGGKRPMLEGEGRVEPELPVVPDDAVTQLYDDIAHDVRSKSDAAPESQGPMKVSTWLRDAITFDDTLRDD